MRPIDITFEELEVQLTGNVYVETGFMGANVGFVRTGEGIVMIDTPWRPSDAVDWREKMADIGELRYIINTEPHLDHFTGNFFFPATVIGQEKTRAQMAQATPEGLLAGVKDRDPKATELMKGYFIRLPAITFSDHLNLYLGDHSFQLLHTPGHSAGQTAIYIPEEKTVFTGDNITYHQHGWLHEALPYDWLESLGVVATLEVEHIIPGHGDICDKSALKEQETFIRDWIAAVKDAKKKGWTKEESIGRISLLDRYPVAPGTEAMGPELQKMNVSRLYDVLTAD